MGSDSIRLRHYSFLGIVNVTCPLDINKCPFVHWTNRNVHWTYKCPFVQWTNRNVHWTFKCPFVQWTNRNVHWTSKCPFVHWTNGHCLMASTLVSYPHGVRLSQITSLQLPWHCKRYMSIGYINVYSSIGPTEMSIGHSLVHLSIGQTEMSIRPLDEQKCPLDIQMSICALDEWTLSNGKHSSLQSTWGQTQSDYVITASLAL